MDPANINAANVQLGAGVSGAQDAPGTRAPSGGGQSGGGQSGGGQSGGGQSGGAPVGRSRATPSRTPLPEPARAAAWREPRVPWLRFLREALGVARLLASPARDRVANVYDVLSTHNNLGAESLFLNLGYWREAATYDEACAALAILLAEAAGLREGDRVLDAGFGFGDQDILWARRFSPASIVGFNLTAAQVKVARQRVALAGLADRVDLRLGSALETGLADGSVDAVLALESAFHFDTREDFFREASRVLRPGGRLALADIVPLPRLFRGYRDRMLEHVGRSFWQIPAANYHPAEVYREKLRRCGFVDVRLRSIAAHVFAPFKAYARARQGEAEIIARANPLIRAIWRAPTELGAHFDYLLVSASRA